LTDLPELDVRDKEKIVQSFEKYKTFKLAISIF
jgi:hypothetical protein